MAHMQGEAGNCVPQLLLDHSVSPGPLLRAWPILPHILQRRWLHHMANHPLRPHVLPGGVGGSGSECGNTHGLQACGSPASVAAERQHQRDGPVPAAGHAGAVPGPAAHAQRRPVQPHLRPLPGLTSSCTALVSIVTKLHLCTLNPGNLHPGRVSVPGLHFGRSCQSPDT